jgi:hypothetical protein
VSRGQRNRSPCIFGSLDRSRYYLFQVAPQLHSWGWVDLIPDPLLLRRSGSAGNRSRDLWICSQELWPLDHRGSPKCHSAKQMFCSDINTTKGLWILDVSERYLEAHQRKEMLESRRRLQEQYDIQVRQAAETNKQVSADTWPHCLAEDNLDMRLYLKNFFNHYNFSIDNAHPNIFITPFNVLITRIRQLEVELGSTDRRWRNSLKACVLLVVILSLMKNFLDFNSLMFNKY